MEQKTSKVIDWYLFLAIALLMLLSLAFVYTASAPFSLNERNNSEAVFFGHLIKTLIAFIAMFLAFLPDYKFYQKNSKYLMLLSLLLLMVVFLFPAAKGAHRWISIGFFTFQPSDIARIALILHFATLLDRNQFQIKSFSNGLLPLLIWMGIIVVLIALEPNVSTVLVIVILSFSLMFLGNVRLTHLLLIFAFFIVMIGAYSLTAEYRLHRLMAFFGFGNPNVAVKYQLDQSLLALGNGGFLGVGLGQSRQSQLFLPESFSDFIFSIIGEELGYIGLLAILAIYIFIIYRCIKIAKKAPDLFSFFVASGVTISFSIYIIVNIGVNCGILPTTGLPLPFISHGGTAIVFNAFAMGILLRISSHTSEIEKKSRIQSSEYSNDDENSEQAYTYEPDIIDEQYTN